MNRFKTRDVILFFVETTASFSRQGIAKDDDLGVPLTIRTWWQLVASFCCVSLHRAIVVGMGLVRVVMLADTRRRLCLVSNPAPRLGLQKIGRKAFFQLSRQPEWKDK
jgi:hypothetical protein